jgi:hypothetical protein
MRVILLIFLLISCKRNTKMVYVETPSKTEFDKNGRIKPKEGYENAKKMKYYNTLQHKSFYYHGKNKRVYK